MWYRCGAVALMGWSLACSDAASPPPAAPEPGETSPAVMTPEVRPGGPEAAANGAGLQLWIEGWTEEIYAKAQLNVTEGVRAVRLEITGGGVRDVLLVDVAFDGIEGSMGLHQLEVGLPGGGLDSAVASLGGQTYHSQAGEIEVNLSADGSITGSFELALAQDPEVAAGEPIVFELSDELRDLKGQFSGRWDLFCLSHMPGHMSSLMKGGHYCDGISF